MPGGVALGAGVVLGTVGPNATGLEEFVAVDDEAGALPLAVSGAWRERDIKATIPARTSAAITAITSHFFGCVGRAGSTGVCSLLCRLAIAGAVANILEQLWECWVRLRSLDLRPEKCLSSVGDGGESPLFRDSLQRGPAFRRPTAPLERLRKGQEPDPSGLIAPRDDKIRGLTARLKLCPDTNQPPWRVFQPTAAVKFALTQESLAERLLLSDVTALHGPGAT